MEDYNRVLEATSVAENANGVAAEKMTVYNESLEAAQNRLTASVQQFAQDSNLDRTLALAYDGLSKVVEILNILLNKIPVLSPLIKAMGVALATAFASNMLNNLAKTSTGIGTIISTIGSAIPNLQAFVSLVGSEFVTAMTTAGGGLAGLKAGAIAAGGAITTLINPITLTIAGLGALLVIIPKVVTWFNNLKNAKENALKQSSQELDEANQNLEETNGQIKDIQDKISEINSKDSMTLTDQAEKERLEEELETLKQIKQVQEDIANSKKSETLQDTKDVIREKYSDDEYGFDYYGALTSSPQTGDYQKDTYEAQTANIGELIANIKYLDEAKKNLTATDEDYQAKLTQVNQLEQENTQQLLSKKQELLEYKQQLINLGDTSSEEYQLVNDKINDITVALDPSKFPKIDLGEMIQTEGMENKIKMVIQSGSEAGKKVAEGYAKSLAEEIENNPVSLEAWKEALNIPDGQELGVGQLTQEILALFQEMFGGISEASETASQGFTDQHTALDAYQEAVQNVHDSTTDLTAAYQDMISKGYISESVVKKLTAAHPELTKELKLENGQYKINLQTLKDVYTTEVNKSIASIKAEKEQTQATIDAINKRIQAYELEMNALALDPNATEADKAKLIGLQHSIDMSKTQLKRLRDDAADVDKYIANLQQNAVNWSPTKSSGSKSSGKSAADKAAKEFESGIKQKIKDLKGVVTLYSEDEGWASQEVIDKAKADYEKILTEIVNDPKARAIAAESLGISLEGKDTQKQIDDVTAALEKQAGTIDEAYQKLSKKALNEMDKVSKAREKEYEDAVKNIESLQKMTVNMIETAIDLLQKAGDFVFDLIGKLSEKYDKQIDALDAQMDNLDKIADNLDNQKDAFDDKIDAQKEMLKLQKEEMDNADELAEKNKSIADIDAQLMELQYDDSAEAQAKRLKLLDERAQKEKDLSDYQKDQAYDTKVNALDREKDAYDKNIEAQKKYVEAQKEALKEQQDAIKAAQDKFEQNLSKAQNVFNGFIKVISSDIFKKLAANVLDSLDGKTLKKVLTVWNKWFGDGLESTVKNTWDKAYASADWLGWKKGSSISDILNIGKQGQQNEKDIQTIISNALTKNESGVIDFSGIKNNVDSMSKSFADFSKNALQSITKVDTKTSGVVQNVLNLGKQALNAAANSSNGVISTLAKGIQKITGVSNAGIISVGNSGNGFIAKLSQNGINSILQMGTTGQGVLGNLGNIAGGILNQLAQGGVQILKGLGGIARKVVSGIGGIIGKVGSALGIGSAGTAAAGVAGTGGLAGVGGALASVASTAGTLALPVAAIGTGIIGGIQSFKNIRNVWQDENASVLKKVATTALNISPIGIVGNAIGSVIKGVGKFLGFHHSGSDYVKKEHPELDRMLGLKDDETVSVLKVGEAVVPTWANSASSSASNNRFTGSPFGSAVDSAVKSARASMGNSNVSNTTDSSINISMPINIKGDADESTVRALRDATNNIVNSVLRTINTQTRMGGYRNIKAATI